MTTSLTLDRPIASTSPALPVIASLLRHGRLLLPAALLAATAAAGWRLTRAPEWKAEATILPTSSGATSSLAGVASQFGVALPTSDATQSPGFYVELLQSRDVRERLISALGGDAALATALRVEEQEPLRRHERVLDALRKVMDLSSDPKTGVVRVVVITTDAPLSLRLVETLVQLAQMVPQSRRQERARAELAFYTARVDGAVAEVRSAERALTSFRSANRVVTGSPVLQIEQARLERRIGEAQQVVAVLRQAEEQARIESVRDTPALTVVQSPVAHGMPERRRTVLFVLLALFGTLAAGVAMSLALPLVRGARAALADT